MHECTVVATAAATMMVVAVADLGTHEQQWCEHEHAVVVAPSAAAMMVMVVVVVASLGTCE